MGKKKGKQSGVFASKALKAAYSTELNANIQEARNSHDRNRKSRGYSNEFSKGSKNNPRNSFEDLSMRSVRNARPSVNHLRGLIMERRWEDRFQDREMRLRLQMQRNSIRTNTLGITSSVPPPSPCQNFPGWIHFHKNEQEIKRDNLIVWSKRRYGFRDRKRAHVRACPSLQSLCIKALAPCLNNYIQQCGSDTIHSILTTLSAQAITSLSTLTLCQNYEMVYVLGKHTHLDRLTLRFSKHMNTNERSKFSSLDDAILDLIPRIKHHENDCEQNRNSPGDQCDPNESSWEEMLENNGNDESVPIAQSFSWEGCVHLTRFEIRDVPNISPETIFLFLQKCTKVTHLSFCNSLDSYTGIEVLLHPEKGILGKNVRFAVIGEVLDLSLCQWLTDGILLQFLGRLHMLVNATKYDEELQKSMIWDETDIHDEIDSHKEFLKSSRNASALKVIRVLGCPHINIEKCKSYCLKAFGRSFLNEEEHNFESLKL